MPAASGIDLYDKVIHRALASGTTYGDIADLLGRRHNFKVSSRTVRRHCVKKGWKISDVRNNGGKVPKSKTPEPINGPKVLLPTDSPVLETVIQNFLAIGQDSEVKADVRVKALTEAAYFDMLRDGQSPKKR